MTKIKNLKVVPNWVTTFFCVSFLIFASCRSNEKQDSDWQYLEGETMGTTYHITLNSDQSQEHWKSMIDSTLKEINKALSTYDDQSLISAFNKSSTGKISQDRRDSSHLIFFQEVWSIAQVVYYESKGAFDPSASAIFNLWGFGDKKRENLPSDSSIAIALENSGFDSLRFPKYQKTSLAQSLNFNAVAKGYGVDVVYELLSDNGLENYMVEIGGEVRASGVNSRDQSWVIGINKPEEGSAPDDFITTVELNNEAMATSGNYRNYFYYQDKKYSHTIDPRTGYPIEHDLLSATVIADNCALADALATAAMVVGEKEAEALLLKFKGTRAILVSRDTNSNEWKINKVNVNNG